MPPRKRIKTSKAATKGKNSQCVIDAKKGKGRAPITSRKALGKCGGLAGMPDMPLDILFEIFSLLHPQDLVNLCRTAKQFRAFLMSRESSPLWRAARKQVDGLPDCPPFLSEPAYANLVFFTHCHGCAKARAQITLWNFAVRYCAKCKAAQLIQSHSVRKVVSAYQGREILLSTKLSYSEVYYHRPQFDHIRTTWKNGFASDADRTSFIEQVKADVHSRLQFGGAIGEWADAQDARKAAQLDALRAGRIQWIEQRLRQEGWGEVLDWDRGAALTAVKQLKQVCKAQALTDRGWNTIRKDVMQVVEQYRDRRFYAQRVSELRPRFVLLFKVIAGWLQTSGLRTADTDWYPCIADLALLPVFRHWIDVPANIAVHENALSKFQEQLPDFITTWHMERKSEIMAIVIDALDSVPDDVDPLSLAVATFDCRRCSYRGMRWLQLLSHDCARSREFENTTMAENMHKQAVVFACDEQREKYAWDIRVFVFNPCLATTRLAIQACDEDPDVATYEDMDRCSVRVKCNKCTRICEALTWKKAAHHTHVEESSACDETVPTLQERQFEKLSAEDTATALELEALQQLEAEQARLTDENNVYGCRRCRYRANLLRMSVHCSSAHGIKDARRHVDYYLHADNVPYTPTPIRIYSKERRQAALATIADKTAFVSSSI